MTDEEIVALYQEWCELRGAGNYSVPGQRSVELFREWLVKRVEREAERRRYDAALITEFRLQEQGERE